MKFSMRCILLAVCISVSGCAKQNVPECKSSESSEKFGNLVVKVSHESANTRSVADYGRVLSDESAVNNLEVFVFDAVTGRLERSLIMTSADMECRFELPVGEKVVYAVVNGPDMSKVQSLAHIRALRYDLSDVSLAENGFVMIGSEECVVSQGVVSYPEVMVRRLVSRVELRSVKCNVASQYEAMKVECAYLGDAYSCQSFSGEVSALLNPGGYADSEPKVPIGLAGIKGSCPEYLYRDLDMDVVRGDTSSEPVYLYCQPNGGQGITCLYLLISIGEGKYYYRVPLDKGLLANTTCVVNAVITNLGAPLPPDGDVQKGEIVASITIEDWDLGDQYYAEF